MGVQIDKIRAREQMSAPEILTGLIWDRAVNSRDHVFRVAYYQFPCYLEYVEDGAAHYIDCYYLQQENRYSLIQPKYKEILAIAPEILNWLDATFATFAPPEPPRPKRGKKGGATNNQQIAQAIMGLKNSNQQMRPQRQKTTRSRQ